MERLLAKRVPDDVLPVTLCQHTEDVCEAAAALFGTPIARTRLGMQWLRFFRLDPTEDYEPFVNNVTTACLFHDWGKANEHMQEVLRGRGRRQLFRHEHLSVLMLGHCGVAALRRKRPDIDWDIVLAAIGSHHLRFADQDFANAVPGETTRVYFCQEEFQAELLPLIAERLNLEGSLELPPEEFWGFSNGPATFNPTELRDGLRDGLLRELTLTSRDGNSRTARMLRAVRSALIAADAAGSGLRRTDVSISSWVRDQFREDELCDFDFVRGVVTKRIEQLVAAGKWQGAANWNSDGWNEFQTDCDTLPQRTVLLAPCGSGKTLAAWRWIAAQVRQRPVKRILFLYPTRASATEGFKDYVSWAPEADASLMHASASYDLEGMFAAEDPRTGKLFDRSDPRLFALRHWSKRVLSATVDQFMAFMSYAYAPMCLLPMLVDSVIVVDEVHSFDRAMLSAVLGFLDAFDVPVMCITATLQSGRKEQLRQLVDSVYEERPGDLAEIAAAPRYHVERIKEDEAESLVRRRIADQANACRILWVVNQVRRAQYIARSLSDVGVPLFCYHSRFKLDDRVERHREVVAAIRSGEPSAVAITTQVCEMSLDIDADVLITEDSPIPSLIQRMGRCRRGRDELSSKGPGEVFIYRPEVGAGQVYSPEDMHGVGDFVAYLESQETVSQADLEKCLDKFGSNMADAPRLNSFLTSGAYAVAGEESFRDIEAFNVPAILRGEISEYVKAPKRRKPGYIVPVPRKLAGEEPNARLPRYLKVADERYYDAKTGFWDEPIR